MGRELGHAGVAEGGREGVARERHAGRLVVREDVAGALDAEDRGHAAGGDAHAGRLGLVGPVSVAGHLGVHRIVHLGPGGLGHRGGRGAAFHHAGGVSRRDRHRLELAQEPGVELGLASADGGLGGGEAEGDALPVLAGRLADGAEVGDVEGLALHIGADVVGGGPGGSGDDVGKVEGGLGRGLGLDGDAGDVAPALAGAAQLGELAADLVGVAGVVALLVGEGEGLLVELGQLGGVELDEGGPLGGVELGVGRVLARGGQAAEDLVERILAGGHARGGATELVLRALEGAQAVGEGAHLVVGDLGDLDALAADVEQGEVAGAAGTDRAEVGGGREVVEGQHMRARLEVQLGVAHHLGAVGVDGDCGDGGVGPEVGGAEQAGEGEQGECGGAHGRGVHHFSGTPRPGNLSNRPPAHHGSSTRCSEPQLGQRLVAERARPAV